MKTLPWSGTALSSNGCVKVGKVPVGLVLGNNDESQDVFATFIPGL